MKKTLMVAMAACLALSLGGCGGKDQAAENGIVIWAPQGPVAAALDEMGAAYAKETGVPVKVNSMAAGALNEQVLLGASKDQTPFDIAVVPGRLLGQAVSAGVLLEVKASSLKAMNAKVLRTASEYPVGKKKYYSVPCQTDLLVMAVRKDWLADKDEKAAFKKKYRKALAAPVSWDDLKKVAAFFTRPDQKRFGLALVTGRGGDSLILGFQQALIAFGGSWGDSTTYKVKGKLNSSSSVKALAFYKDLLQYGPPGAANLGEAQAVEAMKAGETAMAMVPVSACADLAGNLGDKVAFMAVPKKGAQRAVSVRASGLVVSAKVVQERQDRAKKFTAWFMTRNVQMEWAGKSGCFSGVSKVVDAKDFKKATAWNAAYPASLSSLRDFWNVTCAGEMAAAARNSLGEALDGSKEPKAALSELAVAHDQMLKDAGYGKKPAPQKASAKAPAKKATRKKR